MSRNQWATITLLALAGALVWCWVGAYLNTDLMRRITSETSALVQPTHVATAAPADVLVPTPSGSAADYGYRLCFQDVAAGSTDLVENLALSTSNGTDDPSAFCEGVAGLQLQTRAAELEAAHQNCPVPSDPHLQSAWRYLGAGLAESLQASDYIERFCAGSKDASLLGEADTHVDRAEELGTLADQELQAYYTS